MAVVDAYEDNLAIEVVSNRRRVPINPKALLDAQAQLFWV